MSSDRCVWLSGTANSKPGKWQPVPTSALRPGSMSTPGEILPFGLQNACEHMCTHRGMVRGGCCVFLGKEGCGKTLKGQQTKADGGRKVPGATSHRVQWPLCHSDKSWKHGRRLLFVNITHIFYIFFFKVRKWGPKFINFVSKLLSYSMQNF